MILILIFLVISWFILISVIVYDLKKDYDRRQKIIKFFLNCDNSKVTHIKGNGLLKGDF